MKKWLDKYTPKAQNGIEGTMGGLTDIGFNYNGAWGGQFQMGGSLPGASGFMYARVGAPSEGPYAKKTEASAQDGDVLQANAKAAQEWLKQWYGQRRDIPEFKGLAESRLQALETPPEFGLKPAKEMLDLKATAYYQNPVRRKDKPAIYSVDPQSLREDQLEKSRKLVAAGKPGLSEIEYDLGISPNVLTHELGHWLDIYAPQLGKDVPKYPSIGFLKQKDSGLDEQESMWIKSDSPRSPFIRTEFNSVLNNLRQVEGLKGNVKSTPEQMKKIVDKYKNLSEKDLDTGTKKGYENWMINVMLKSIGYDAEKLSELNNSIVKGKPLKTDVAQDGTSMSYYQQGLDFKPKTISKNGGWLDKYDEAQEGKSIPRVDLSERGRGDMESYYPEIKQIKTKAATQKTKKEADKEEADRRAKRAIENQPTVSSARADYRTQKEKDRDQFLREQQEGQMRSPLVQTLGSFTPSGYNPVVGLIGAQSLSENVVAFPQAVTNLTRFATGRNPYGDEAFDKGLGVSADLLTTGLGIAGSGAFPLMKGIKNPTPVSEGEESLSTISNATGKLSRFFPSMKKLIGKPTTLKLPEGSPINLRLLAADVTIKLEGERILKNLTSPEGRRRLREQFKQADPSLNNEQLDYLTHSRIMEVNAAVNYNKPSFFYNFGQGAQGTLTENIPFTEFLPIENAHYSHYNPHPKISNVSAPLNLFPPKLAPSVSYLKNQSFDEFMEEMYKKYQKEFANPDYEPGSIALGTNLETNKIAASHEVAHAIQSGGMTPIDVNLLKLLEPKSIPDYLFRGGVKLNRELKKDLNYFTTSDNRPVHSEPYAFLTELRNRMLNRNIIKHDYEKITPWKLAKARLDAFTQVDPNYAEGTRLIKFTPPWKYGKLANIMNTAPASVPVIGAAALLSNDEEQPPKQKEGGIIKDNMGQWAHPGEITEINSNNITMEGVPYPVFGISDTGDTQMMYPGEDYTFDGDYVTEYPMMQKGGRVPIYVDDPKDPRLKSYTDSLNLYKAMQMQDKLMGPGNKPIKGGYKWTTQELKEGRTKKTVKGLEDYGPMSDDFQSESEQFKEGFNPLTARKEDKKLLDYYKSLGFKPDQIMYHSSPDIVSDKIRAIGSYFDGTAQSPVYKKPEQPVQYRKPEPSYIEKFGLTSEDVQRAYKTKPVVNKGDVYYNVNKGGKKFKIHTQSGGLNYIEEIKQPKAQKKTEPAPVASKQQSAAPPPIERKQNIYEGSPVYSPGIGSGLPSALIGFANQKGDTTYIKPEDYERFAVPKYGKEYIEGKKKQRNGGVNKADEYSIEKLDQLLNFTNYNKPTKGGWLDKYK